LLTAFAGAGFRVTCLNQSGGIGARRRREARCELGWHSRRSLALQHSPQSDAYHCTLTLQPPMQQLKTGSDLLRAFNCRAATRRTDRYMALWLGLIPVRDDSETEARTSAFVVIHHLLVQQNGDDHDRPSAAARLSRARRGLGSPVKRH
jgi:hypothetical protein